ncbi:FMRFamide receptor-like [Mercenaria mercenaria]|uniref:FMRFamide receptor-like n=1 Tax=Mercenaria mercenaria TaxID=6596 RepID=UPI00234F14E1|nr:FMRFamide receptor-like [Mercenaria mercenaria]XP_053393260.1 FMRFamide receptor-like [Mercenaria mercenaria]XP_053393261.1 FMRFamide receptor-like [Mercenaria mercenaria]XP_053393262.1 FMRFamide receptor-like [Mercenaria mercenaria]XP_053393263.1 FMRFamide receptor-like [Mercenaria mercenaria]XP_053393264.1 FMRFamide receptor-like [Mercenaria mercenaria]XP_053393265.1 FMRFamide receptor-like [Mercenaria mercenaria]XP_053393266.1 FMRFamide receptor-like [Mercenaria mercenaria]XP_05339326
MHVKELNLKVNLTYGDDNIQDDEGDSLLQLMFIFWGVIMPVIGIIGIVGNILTGIVLFRREMRSTTVYFLRTLIITDTGIIAGAIMGVSVISITQLDKKEWLFNDVIYPHIFTPTNYFVMTLQTLNVWTTVAVSVERYIAICFPFKSINICNKRNAYIVIGVTTVFSIVYNIPRCFGTGFTTCGNNCYMIITTEFGKSEFYTIVYSEWLYTILIYIIPLLLLGVLNTLLIVELTRMRRRRRLSNTEENTEFNLSIVLVIIVVVFILCQTPGLVAQFQFLDPDFIMQWTCVSNTLFVLNSSVNFLIYTAVGKKFRTLLLRIIKNCLRRKTTRSGSYWNTDRELTTLTVVKETYGSGVNSDELSALKESEKG